MHINSERLIQTLTDIELRHIENCTQCHNERQKLIALKISANQLELIEPPVKQWSSATAKKTANGSWHAGITRNIVMIAASVSFVVFGWLIWSNVSLHSQIEQILLANQRLESMILQEQVLTYRQTQILMKVSEIDYLLSNEQANEVKLNLLRQRNELMTQLSSKKGENHDFSI